MTVTGHAEGVTRAETGAAVRTAAVPAPASAFHGQASAWWRDAVIYQVYVRSFADGNGDGVGDLLGIRTRLPYLRALGADAVWITPFYASPMADGGYDVTEHREVDPLFGTLGDAEALVSEAHRLGIRIIVDIVPNHTSAEHRWFREAVAAGPGHPSRDRYIFRAGRGEHGELPPNDWESVFGGPAWTRLAGPTEQGTEGAAGAEADGEWYLHLFDPAQPDLNWRNPEVRVEHEQILRFWLDRGVDGFRIDVAHGMIKQEGLPDVGYQGQIEMLGTSVLPYFDQDEVHEIHREWRRILDEYPGQRMAVAEAWAPSLERLAAYVRPDELHQAFNFHFLTTPWRRDALRQVIEDSVRTSALVGAPATWVLSNHDTRRHVTRYGGGERGLRRARAAALLMLALPGSAYLYQGEELGLEEVLDLPAELLQDPQRLRSADGSSGRDGCRVPLPWGGTESPYNFTPLNTTDGWLPAPRQWRDKTVEAQWDRAGSTLALYRRALELRRELPALGDGELGWRASIEVLAGDPETLLAFDRAPGFLCTVNVGDHPLTIARPGTVELASTELDLAAETVTLPPDSAAWWTID